MTDTDALNMPYIEFFRKRNPIISDPFPFIKNIEFSYGMLTRLGVTDPHIYEAFYRTPRHLFLPHEYQNIAYCDSPCPIGYGQITAAPSTVAQLLQWLELEDGMTVAHYGTGRGYITNLIASITGYETIAWEEINPELANITAGTPLPDFKTSLLFNYARILVSFILDDFYDTEPYLNDLTPTGILIAPVNGTLYKWKSGQRQTLASCWGMWDQSKSKE